MSPAVHPYILLLCSIAPPCATVRMSNTVMSYSSHHHTHYTCSHTKFLVQIAPMCVNTLQVIAFLDALLENSVTGFKRMLVIVPKNTISNWVDEFQRWLKDENDYYVSVQVYM